MQNAKNDILWRVYLLYAGMLLFGFAIIGRIAYIQIYLGEELLAKAAKQELRIFPIDAMRGNILSSDGSLLATTVPVFEVRMDVSSPLIDDQLFNSKVDSLATGLSKILQNKTKSQYLSDLKKARREGNRYFLIKKKVTYAEVKQLRKAPIINKGKYKGGLILIPGNKREKPFKELAHRTIGYENQQEKLFVGIEGAYHEYLKGIDGKQLKRRINNGDWKPLFDENSVEPQNGKDIITTIDVNIQDVAESALRRNLTENQAEQGCAILMEVATGQIVAISNLSLNKKTGLYKETYNYAIAESVEPGSTFKLASIMALLEDKKIHLRDSMNIGSGQMKYFSRTMRDVHSIRNGRITVREAFEKSSNVAISKLVYNAYKEKPEKFIERLYSMSLNIPLNLDIPGEGKPYIKHPSDKKHWYGTSLPWISIGYEITLTPLQILTFYNAVANNGKMVKPQFVKEIRQGNVIIESFEPIVINKSIATQSTIDSVKNLMEGVVERGTAKFLSNSPFKIAGKTGTAQIASGKKGYNKKNYTASFVGYFPAGKPQYSCIVVISNPSAGKIYGGAVSAPVFQEIADKVYATRPGIHDGIAEDKTLLAYIPSVHGACNSNDALRLYQLIGVPASVKTETNEWIQTIPNGKAIAFQKADFDQGTIPNVLGMNAKDAVYLLENLGLKTQIKGKGVVISQSLLPGDTLSKGQKIELNLLSM
ncbi:MAG: cell division protein [Bacteroidetes bacterium HGW-Bacteroidetes-1]|jgi:cell division protein FtsI (penicillin-binding protein 3)|nr:MAG: cell division protein [Bacteroidetes bacterium HGW-Bacteroidetes-1]